MSYDPTPPSYGQPMIGGSQEDKNREYAAIASLILGILSVVTCCIPCCGFIFCIAGLGTGYYGMNSNQRTLAYVGMGLSALGLGLSFLSFVLNGAAMLSG